MHTSRTEGGLGPVDESDFMAFKRLSWTIVNLVNGALNTHCYRNSPHDLLARSGISFFRSPVLRVPYCMRLLLRLAT